LRWFEEEVKVSKVNNPKIKFGTDGWRGIIADDFTFPNVWKVTRAIAKYLETAYTKERAIIVACDTRFLAEEFAYSSAEVLADLGWSVKVSNRDTPTPVIAYNVRLLGCAGALMFTASHNKASYCGIKYIPDYGGPATPDVTDAILQNLEHSSALAPSGNNINKISKFDPKPQYLKFISNFLDCQAIRRAKLKIKYDALYSTSRGYLDEILMACGTEVETLHNYRDVLFGGGLPEPKAEQLQDLIVLVREDRADLGIATDGDGDRFCVIDERGEIVSPNAILLLLARHLLENKGKSGAIVRTVATTHLLDIFARQYHLKLIETPVGFKYIGQMMRETDVLIGGEESGGLSVCGHIPEKDGILANMLIIEAIAIAGKPLSQLVEEVITAVGGPVYSDRVDFQLSELDCQDLLTKYRTQPPQEVAGIKVARVSFQDGIKIYLEEDSWILIRPSGTEPLMRIYLETNSLQKYQQLLQFCQTIP
jgi:phosphomannomutase